jgi:superfamily II DNA or RNA helicase
MRLARRFDSRLLPENQKELKQRLLKQGVLAQVDSEALQSGVDLLDEEISQLTALWTQRDGIDFDRLLEDINQRLGGSSARNGRLVQRIQQAEERSILFFANSVQHAVEISARLNLAGITAAAISGETPTAARRFFLDRFQRGEVRVLCNHSVLTTGFDAPKTDMVLISRQVFSPVRYMQMVGRGLRGPANGGTARCRIVTVLDNLRQFAGEHPYHRYWQGYLNETQTPTTV